MRFAGLVPKVLASAFIREIVSTLIAGVIVVVVDWKLVKKAA